MRPRRDPHGERLAFVPGPSGRPRLARGAAGATGRPRRDPRAERQAQQVAGAPRPRFDRTQMRGTARALEVATPSAAAPQLIIVETPAFYIAVVPDAAGGRLSAHDRQLFGAARTLAGREGAVVALCAEGCEDLGAAGADRVIPLPSGSSTYDPDGAAGALAAILASLQPRATIFPESARGGDLLRRVAVASRRPVFCDVEFVSESAVARPAQVRRIEQRTVPRGLIGLTQDAVAPYARGPREARPMVCEASPAPASASAILSVEEIPADPRSVPLALADFVIAAGNGVTDFETFRSLVEALGGTLGASRVLCDAGLMPRAAQVGASGTVLSANCYLALGIAGAPQHLQGIAGCDHVVAVNTDLHAAMVERAGLAIVADAQRIMPALLDLLRAEREA